MYIGEKPAKFQNLRIIDFGGCGSILTDDESYPSILDGDLRPREEKELAQVHTTS